MTFDTKGALEPVSPAPIHSQLAVFGRCQWTNETPISDASRPPPGPTALEADRLELDHRVPESKPEVIHYVTAALLKGLSTSSVHDVVEMRSLADIEPQCRQDHPS